MAVSRIAVHSTQLHKGSRAVDGWDAPIARTLAAPTSCQAVCYARTHARTHLKASMNAKYEVLACVWLMVRMRRPFLRGQGGQHRG